MNQFYLQNLRERQRDYERSIILKRIHVFIILKLIFNQIYLINKQFFNI